MRKRRFSRREEAVVERMIRDAIRELALERGSAEELHAIGWQAFLSVYHYDPVGFRWDGAGGWARAYQAVYDALSAYKKQRNDDCYRLISLDKPISGENETPLISRLPTHHGDFSQYVCLCDYLSRLPWDEQQLAWTLINGYDLEEIPAAFYCDPKEVEGTYHRLRESMEQYLRI